MEKAYQPNYKKSSPKCINALVKLNPNSPRTPSPPRSKKKKVGEPSPLLKHIERNISEKYESDSEDDIPNFNLLSISN